MGNGIQDALNKIAEGKRELEAAIKAQYPVGQKVRTSLIGKDKEGVVVGHEGANILIDGVAKTTQKRSYDKVTAI